MEYIHRSLERKFMRMSGFFKAGGGAEQDLRFAGQSAGEDAGKDRSGPILPDIQAADHHRRGSVCTGAVQPNQNHLRRK